jgi:hypothetical protein
LNTKDEKSIRKLTRQDLRGKKTLFLQILTLHLELYRIQIRGLQLGEIALILSFHSAGVGFEITSPAWWGPQNPFLL